MKSHFNSSFVHASVIFIFHLYYYLKVVNLRINVYLFMPQSMRKIRINISDKISGASKM